VRAHRDPDLLLIEEMLAPPPLADALRSLEYWERRQRTLPLYQRRARREAREMAARCEAQVRDAERARFESSPVGRILSTLGLSGLFLLRARLTKWRVLSLAWTLVPRKIKLVAGGFVAAWLIVALATLAAVAVMVARVA
jgi:hypothetical protein